MPHTTKRQRGKRSAFRGRAVAAQALAQAAEHFPDLPIIALDCAAMPPEEARLAVAIYRTAMQRWITLEHLLNRYMGKKLSRLEPAMQGVLLSGAAQLVAMDRLPVYAVVDESVAIARQMVRPGAAGMVNAVLRRLSSLVGSVMEDVPWRPAADRLPRDPGCIALHEPALPDVADVATHLAVATSHPRALVKDWLSQFGEAQAIELLAHSLKQPPTFVHEPDGAVAMWDGTHEALVEHLAQDPRRRVQDPTSALTVEAVRGLPIRSALDLCAGRGTKSRQLATLFPEAQVVASDPDEDRFEDLRGVARQFAQVQAVKPEEVGEAPFDLVLLDVPCTNSGVFARRPEAKFRYTAARLASVAALQRRIIEAAVPRVRPGGWLLYATCSIHPVENQTQAAAIVRLTGGELIHERLTLPGGCGGLAGGYHDGGYHALVRVPQ